MFSVGDKIGVYEIVAELKSGGMATLFLGRRAGAAGFAKPVAIKVVHDHLAEDPSFVQMFVDEALLSARIQHPNIVHVEELGESDGTHFLVMEYVQGGSLGQLLRALAQRRRRLSPELAIYIAVKVADGLHAAHETRGDDGELLGVVHRDVSPQNILFSYQGTVKLIDFGVAKAKGRAQETAGGLIKGKFRYMSPEHALGRELDRRSDIYTLAVVLWEMLTMRRRFEGGADIDVLSAVRHPDVIPPSRFAPKLSAEIDEVVLKAMSKSPDDRHQSARELRDDLVAVCPEAVALHESVLGSLLVAVLGERLVRERKKLPSSIPGLEMPQLDVEGTAALAKMTLSDEDVGAPDSGDGASIGTHQAATRLLQQDAPAAEVSVEVDLPDEDQAVLEDATVVTPGLPEHMGVRVDPTPPPAPDTDPPPPGSPAQPALGPRPSQRSVPTESTEVEPRSRTHPAWLAAGVSGFLLLVGGGAFAFVVHVAHEPTRARPVKPAPTPVVSAEPPASPAVPAEPPTPPVDAVSDAGGRSNVEAPVDAGPRRVQRRRRSRDRLRRRGRSARRGGRRRSSDPRQRRGRAPIADEW